MTHSRHGMPAMRAPREIEEIDAGVWAVRVPMPRHPLRASFCYVYAGADGAAAVIDPGWPTEESWLALDAALRSIGVDVARITTILLTHAHRDHSGLAGRLAAISSAPVALHADDRGLIARDEVAHRARVTEWLELVGAGDDMETTAPTATDLPKLPETVTIDHELHDGDTITVPSGELTVRWTPGHTPGHVCFEDRARGLLFSGDHLLPRITPNISSMVGHHDTALSDYLDSLSRVARLPVTRILPGHEHSFTDHPARITQLREHHRARLHDILHLVTTRARWSTYDVARELQWSRPWDQFAGLQRRAALGEVLSHLHYLRDVGAVNVTQPAASILWSAREPGALNKAWAKSASEEIKP